MHNKDNIIPYGRHEITQDDIDAVVNTLKSEFLTQGPKIEEFEIEFAKYIGVKYAIAVSNGTAALHLSGLALGIKKGSKVITSPLSFVATSNSVLYCGGEIDFCDINPNTLCLDIDLVNKKLKASPKGTYSGIIPIDFAGYPVKMDEFKSLAEEYGLWLLEDSCHAPGAMFHDSNGNFQNCGNGQFTDLAIFSFHPVKHISCGEGGIITTNNRKLYQKILRLRSHGITKDKNLLQENHGGWYYEMNELGYNYRMSDINASLGLSQLSRAKDNLLKRRLIAKKYDEAFKDLEWIKPVVSVEGHSYHLYIIKTEKRKELYDFLRKENIFSQVHYIPIHLHPFYKSFGWKSGDFPITEDYYEKCLSIPIYPTLERNQQSFIIEKIKSFNPLI